MAMASLDCAFRNTELLVRLRHISRHGLSQLSLRYQQELVKLLS
jgi:hypothetical protein